MTKPKVLYKYENFNTNSLINLKAQSLYFGSPSGFNDPYDSAIVASVRELSDKDLDAIRTAHINKDDVPEGVKRQFNTLSNANLKIMLTSYIMKIYSARQEQWYKNNGVTCFSETNSDLLMWAHYGGKYKGFCLEFLTSYEPFSKMRKVEYEVNIPKIDLMPMLIDDNYDQIIKLLCTKSESWKYEKEWRVIHQEVGKSYVYEASALKAVYFGPEIAFEALEIICLILNGQNPDVEFWRGIRSRDEFKINFERFNYTPYLEAK